ncbi:hypothetical protein SS50377_21913 [Spironucleus salmonicida]|uniref:Uncharacterized protein n=1 Tax=Spironucleus salmonicida TaxID=348837 RepID=V6LJB0_9EUKA|nr:hypothetical protein SS50377_21913 [Spironucleus salmonicida]|eukprot:EST44453.1 Hypothetical protein SS50377_15761 [Spironucleus salmonicida]
MQSTTLIQQHQLLQLKLNVVTATDNISLEEARMKRRSYQELLGTQFGVQLGDGEVLNRQSLSKLSSHELSQLLYKLIQQKVSNMGCSDLDSLLTSSICRSKDLLNADKQVEGSLRLAQKINIKQKKSTPINQNIDQNRIKTSVIADEKILHIIGSAISSIDIEDEEIQQIIEKHAIYSKQQQNTPISYLYKPDTQKLQCESQINQIINKTNEKCKNLDSQKLTLSKLGLTQNKNQNITSPSKDLGEVVLRKAKISQNQLQSVLKENNQEDNIYQQNLDLQAIEKSFSLLNQSMTSQSDESTSYFSQSFIGRKTELVYNSLTNGGVQNSEQYNSKQQKNSIQQSPQQLLQSNLYQTRDHQEDGQQQLQQGISQQQKFQKQQLQSEENDQEPLQLQNQQNKIIIPQSTEQQQLTISSNIMHKNQSDYSFKSNSIKDDKYLNQENIDQKIQSNVQKFLYQNLDQTVLNSPKVDVFGQIIQRKSIGQNFEEEKSQKQYLNSQLNTILMGKQPLKSEENNQIIKQQQETDNFKTNQQETQYKQEESIGIEQCKDIMCKSQRLLSNSSSGENNTGVNQSLLSDNSSILSQGQSRRNRSSLQLVQTAKDIDEDDNLQNQQQQILQQGNSSNFENSYIAIGNNDVLQQKMTRFNNEVPSSPKIDVFGQTIQLSPQNASVSSQNSSSQFKTIMLTPSPQKNHQRILNSPLITSIQTETLHKNQMNFAKIDQKYDKDQIKNVMSRLSSNQTVFEQDQLVKIYLDQIGDSKK